MFAARYAKYSALGACTALLVVPVALAGGPAVSVYGGAGGNVQDTITATPRGGGNLPFTGANIALFVLAGVILVALGLLLRRGGRLAGASRP